VTNQEGRKKKQGNSCQLSVIGLLSDGPKAFGVFFSTEISVNDLDQAWCRGNLSCHNDMHSQL
jgi:hypothetical protein